MDYGNTTTPNMHTGLGSATLSQLAFPRESNPNFPWEKSPWDNTVVKKKSLMQPGQGFRLRRADRWQTKDSLTAPLLRINPISLERMTVGLLLLFTSSR